MIRMGTIGTSTITRRTAAASREVEGLRLTATYSRDAARAAALASDLGMDHSYDSLEAMLASDIDAVYVASPNSVHAGQVHAALDAGKHVFCEKPAVPTPAEWDELVTLASDRGVALLENMRSAYDPVMVRAVELLPALGPVRRVSFNYSQRSARYEQVARGERPPIFDPDLGGGALNDLGVYCVHPLVRLFGSPDAVAAFVVPVWTGADASGAAIASYPGLGMVAELSWSKSTWARVGSTIEGEDGTLVFDNIAELRELTVVHNDGRRLSERPENKPDNITYALRRFVEVVGGASASEDNAWSRASIALLQQVRSLALVGR